MGNPLGIDVYTYITPAPNQISITYVIDYAEVPASIELSVLNPNADDEISTREFLDYYEKRVPEISMGIILEVDQSRLKQVHTSIKYFLPNQLSFLPILRVVYFFDYNYDFRSSGEVYYHDCNWAYSARGYREVVVHQPRGIIITDADIPVVSIAAEYNKLSELDPETIIMKDMQEASFAFELNNAGQSEVYKSTNNPEKMKLPEAEQSSKTNNPLLNRLLQFLGSNSNASPSMGYWLLILIIAIAFGALHALTPGHGKALTAAYLVGSRGTIRHAIFLGIIITVSHTFVIYLLGILIWLTSAYFLQETVTYYSTLISGILIILIGGYILIQRIRHHKHQHNHEHITSTSEHSHPVLTNKDKRIVGRWELFGIGIGAGMVPCPDALVVLLLGVSLGKVEWGLAMVGFFSIGLGVTIITLGVVWVILAKGISKILSDSTIRIITIIAAVWVIIIGCIILISGA
jgi:nickel/cobalt transporter (NicO) family protein